MQTKSILLTIGLLALAGATGGALRSQDTPPTSPDSDRARHMTAIKLLWGLNRAELRYKTKHAVYATRDELAASDEFKVTRDRFDVDGRSRGRRRAGATRVPVAPARPDAGAW